MNMCHRLYCKHQFPPKLSKRVRDVVDGACVWGAQIYGTKGIVGDKVLRRWNASCLSFAVAESVGVSRDAVECLAGTWNASLLYRRSAMCLLDHVYRDIQKWIQQILSKISCKCCFTS